ncbi:hypothetical protein AMATHDRAFT_119010, partial [Amanita thiersii Skay4041]
KQATAIQEVTTIKQGSRSAEEHIQLFKQSYMHSGYGETAGIHEFKRSLNSPLLNKCMAVPELPVTLEKWYELVIRLDRQWRQVANNQRQGFNQQAQRNWRVPVNQSQTPAQHQQWRSPTQTVPRDLNAMQVDQNRAPICCYNCGQTSHIARAC